MIDRTKGSDFVFCDGWQWFSITKGFCEYALSERYNIKKRFDYTLCPDELVFTSLAYNSQYKEKLASFGDLLNGSMRYIDWKRGRPYIFRVQDVPELAKKVNTKYAFARKVDNPLIITKVFNCYSNRIK